MFCHTPWYRDLIAEHRGPANQSEIILWPYPIDPWPGEPLPDEHDLLIYAKNGHRPQLLEHLADRKRRHFGGSFEVGSAQGAFSICGISADNPVNARRRELTLSAFRFFRKCRNDLRRSGSVERVLCFRRNVRRSVAPLARLLARTLALSV